MRLWTLNPSIHLEHTGEFSLRTIKMLQFFFWKWMINAIIFKLNAVFEKGMNTRVFFVFCFLGGKGWCHLYLLLSWSCSSGAVLSLTMGEDGESCYSGGLDGSIRCWKMPDLNVDPYDNYGESFLTANYIAESQSLVFLFFLIMWFFIQILVLKAVY